MTTNEDDLLHDFVEKYIQNVRAGFDGRWSQIKPEIYRKHVHECIGGLLSRQATLTIEMAKAPSTWNGHAAPLFLRCMVDAHITLAWILDDPTDRSEKYVHYGLGQEKLYVEYLEEALEEDPDSFDANRMREVIKLRRSWLNGQLADWATEVNVGSWSGISTRDMAKEIGRESLYRHAYVPFSGPVHNMWQHIGIYNVEPCRNPLHKWHVVPSIRRAPVHPDFMYRSSKYISQTYELFDKKMSTTCSTPLPEDFLLNHRLFCGDENNGDAESLDTSDQ